MMNLHLLVLLPALFMTIARPIPIEFNAELDPIPYDDRVLQNLGMVQKGPTLENSNIAYTGTSPQFGRHSSDSSSVALKLRLG